MVNCAGIAFLLTSWFPNYKNDFVQILSWLQGVLGIERFVEEKPGFSVPTGTVIPKKDLPSPFDLTIFPKHSLDCFAALGTSNKGGGILIVN